MMTKPNTDTLIADLLASPCGAAMDARAKYLFRESLYSLVRLAKAEQMMEIKQNVEKLTGIGAFSGKFSPSEEIPVDNFMFDGIQRRFEFHEPE